MREQDMPKDRTWQNNTEQAPMGMERFEKDMQTKKLQITLNYSVKKYDKWNKWNTWWNL